MVTVVPDLVQDNPEFTVELETIQTSALLPFVYVLYLDTEL